MYASLLFGRGHALDSVHAAFVFQPRVNAVALDERDHFLQPAYARLGGGEHFNFPLVCLGVAVVHPEDFRRKKRGLVAAGSCANFENDVLFVVRILRQKQYLEFLFDGRYARLELREFFLGVGAHLSVSLVRQHGFTFGDPALEILVLTILLDDGRNFAMCLGGLLKFRRVAHGLRRGQRLGQLFVARFGLFKSLKHFFSALSGGNPRLISRRRRGTPRLYVVSLG